MGTPRVKPTKTVNNPISDTVRFITSSLKLLDILLALFLTLWHQLDDKIDFLLEVERPYRRRRKRLLIAQEYLDL